MPTAGRPKLTVRLDEAELRRVQAAAHNQGLTGAELSRQLIRWWLGEPGVELPQRPDQEPEPS